MDNKVIVNSGISFVGLLQVEDLENCENKGE